MVDRLFLISLGIFLIFFIFFTILTQKRLNSRKKEWITFAQNRGFRFVNKFYPTFSLKKTPFLSFSFIPNHLVLVCQGSSSHTSLDFYFFNNNTMSTDTTQVMTTVGNLNSYNAIVAKKDVTLPRFIISSKAPITIGPFTKFNDEKYDKHFSVISGKSNAEMQLLKSIMDFLIEHKLRWRVEFGDGLIVYDHISRFNPFTSDQHYILACQLIELIFSTYEKSAQDSANTRR